MHILKRLKPKAILCGLLFYLVSQAIIGTAVTITLMMGFLLSGNVGGDWFVTLSNTGQETILSPYLPLVLFSVRTLCKLGSGALTAQLSQEAPYMNAVAMALLSISIALLKVWRFPPTMGAQYVFLSIYLTLPLIMTGAYWRVKTLKRQSVAVDSLPPIPDVPRA